MPQPVTPHPTGAPVCPWNQAAQSSPAATAFIAASGKSLTWADLERGIWNAQQAVRGIDATVLGHVATNTEADVLVLVAALREGRDLMLFGRRTPREEVERDCAGRGAFLVSAETLASSPTSSSNSDIESEQPLTGATLVKTSGSTGPGRWVRHTAAAHLASARTVADRLNLSSADRWGWCLPAHHVGGLSILWRCAFAKAAVVTMPPGSDLAEWMAGLLEDQIPTVLSLVPTQLRDLVDSKQGPPARLHSVIVGGASLSPALLTRATKAGWPIRTTYGMTETGSMVTLSDIWTSEEQTDTDFPVHVGSPLDHAELSSRSGRVHVRAASLGEDFSDEDGWMPTSDGGHPEPDNRWVITGRLDRIIISGGENMDPARIEKAILALPGVEEVRVVGIPDARYGERPVAFVATSDAVPEKAWFEQALASSLASFEIPDLFLPMPDAEEGEAKPVRSRLVSMAMALRDGSGHWK